MNMLKSFIIIVVSFTLLACGGNGSGPGSTTTSGSTQADASAGTWTIRLNGGDAVSSAGGNGGSIDISSYGDVKISTVGTVDASFSIPDYSYSFGDVKASVNADTTVKLSDDATLTAGELYVYAGSPDLYIRGDGTEGNPDRAVTGLSVAAGATLRLPDNNWGAAYLYIPKAVVIDGTVTTTAESLSVDLRAGSFLMVETGGKVTTAAANSGNSGGGITLYSLNGILINKGTIDSGGATDGGSAGYVRLEADTFLFNTGIITAKGGDGTESDGGNGNRIALYAYNASLYSSGTINSSGGNGVNGGAAGGIDMYGGYNTMGRTVISGALQSNGGNGINGNGGNADNSIYLYSETGGALLVNAAISSRGGNSSGTGFQGGAAGQLYLEQYYGYDYGYGEQAPVEGIRISGNIDLSGGTGDSGGSGGYLNINTDYAYDNIPPRTQVELVGYASMGLNGGNGTNGGSAGNFTISTEDAWTGDDYTAMPTGAIINEVAVSARGGNGGMGEGGSGGQGGYLEFEAEGEMYAGTTVVTNSGAIDVSGGEGNSGGDSGTIYFYGHDRLTNTASITANGGNGVTNAGSGQVPAVEFFSTLDIINSGNISAGGGSGVYGGSGGGIGMMAGNHTANSGVVSANGGAGTVDGGNGGLIALISQYVPTEKGTLTVARGTGGTTATDGEIYIDVLSYMAGIN